MLKILESPNVQLYTSLSAKTLKFKVIDLTNSEAEFEGAISHLNDFDKLGQSFSDVKEVFDFVKETKNVRVDLNKMMVTLFMSLGTKKVIDIANIPLKKIVKDESSSDESIEEVTAKCPLSEVLDRCESDDKMKNKVIKKCFRLIVQEIRSLKNQRGKEKNCAQDSEEKLKNFEKYSDEIKEEIEKENKIISEKFNELELLVLKKIEDKTHELEASNVKILESCMKEVTEFKENFSKETTKNQNSDEYMNMLISEKNDSTREELSFKVNEIRSELKISFENLSKETEERIMKETSQLKDYLKEINVKIEQIFEHNVKKEKDSLQVKQVDKGEIKRRQKRIEAHKNQPMYKNFSFDGSTLTLATKPKENRLAYFVVFSRVSFKGNFSFRVKILKMSESKNIFIGILDYSEYQNCKNGKAETWKEFCLRGDGKAFPSGLNLEGFNVGETVNVSINTETCAVKYSVNGKKRASFEADFLQHKQRVLYPFIAMYDIGDKVELFL